MKFIIILYLTFYSFLSFSYTLQELPVQHGGRLKPLDTLASESMRLIYGKSKYQKKNSSVLVLTWLLAPEVWSETEFVQIKNRKLKSVLGLDLKKDYFSQKSLSQNPSIESLLQNLQVKQSKEIKLDSFDQALARLQGQLLRLSQFQTGQIFKVSPQPDGKKWLSVNEFSEEYKEKFTSVLKSMSLHLGDEGDEGLAQKFERNSLDFLDLVYKTIPEAKTVKRKMMVEVFSNNFHPFRYAWICYLLALICMFSFWLSKKDFFIRVFGSFYFAGFLLHLLGFLMRVYISGRAPVSNMYETVLWVPFGTVLFGVLVGKWNKSYLPYVGSCVVAVFCLILSDLAPVILDPSIQPLQAVLRSNFWLMTHVLTITISYSAFFLAFILGDFSLFYHLNENRYREEIKKVTVSIYRSMQIGILLLAVGTVLGGVWADYSWGRFWGWDPKETWAFIALMGYLAVLHARMAGWLKSFGMAASAVVSFSLVIMAWYGVNFWLGAGLHSYGFGAGGVEQVSIFVLLHIIYVLFVGVFRRLKKQS